MRWLASKGRYAEADSIIRKVAKFNRVVINEALEDRADLVPGKAEAVSVGQLRGCCCSCS